uniref:protein mono-ADP-ribosyltransferase PARP14-like n=1 Tax=Pristiophorus japonicus TaxID=55135 RepID=UPI00398F4556
MGWRGFQSDITTRGKRAIVLKGPRSILAAEKERLESCLQSIAWESVTVTEPGAVDFFQGRGKEHLDAAARNSECFVVLQEGSGAGDLPASPGSEVLATYRSAGGLVITVCRGDITRQQVDVIVNAANGDLRHGGGVAKAICIAGGPAIQKESSAWVARHGAVPVGQAAMTGAGKLPCARVIHAVGPQWRLRDSHGAGEVSDLLRSSVAASLELAEQAGFRSIAVPCLSSGIFGVPKDICASAIVSAIEGFGGSSLRHIALIDINADVLSELQRACGQAWSAAAPGSSRSPGARSPTLPPDPRPPAPTVQLKIIIGPIEEQQSDVLVSPISRDLNFHSTLISNAIIAKCPSLKKHFQQGQNLATGAVKQCGVPRDSSLKCRFIYFFTCDLWTGSQDQDNQMLRHGIRSCLEACHKASLSSITFPLGGWSCPKEVAARALLGEVHRFQSENPLTVIETVQIAVHPSDESGAVILREIQEGHQQMRADTMGSKSQSSFYYSLSTSVDMVRINVGDIILQIARGDITKEASDIIVNSTSSNPPRNGVSRAICAASGLGNEERVHTANYSNGEFLLTEPGRLKCKEILHVCGYDDLEMIKKVVKNVLHHCTRLGYKSVSFPAIGTGQGNLKPEIVAEAMFDAIASVAQERSQAQVRLVRIVILDTFIFGTFAARLANRLEEASSPANHLKELANGTRRREEAAHVPERRESAEAAQPAVIEVVGRDIASVRRATSHLQRVREDHFREESLADERQAQLTMGEIERLLQLGQRHGVHVTVERGRVRARGQVGKVTEALASARRVLDAAARREWDELLAKVRWVYVNNGKQLPFDPEANFQLERDHDNKIRRTTVATQGYTFLVDLDRKEATVKETSETIKIKRIDGRGVLDSPTSGNILSTPTQSNRREWDELLAKVRWVYVNNGKELPFDPEANFQLERDHDNKIRRTMVATQGYTFLVDLDRKEVTVKETSETIKIKRIDGRGVLDSPTSGNILSTPTQSNRREWDELLAKVRWVYVNNGKELPFDPEANFQLERDHDNKIRHTTVATQGYTFLVDLDRKEVTVKETSETIKIKRIDGRGGRNPLDNREDVKEKPQLKVSLDKSSEEYQTVAKNFSDRCGRETIKIIGIEKIQNDDLRAAYLAKKSAMEVKKSAQERTLYHATDHSARLDIVHKGFSKSSNECQYGKGVYFTENLCHRRNLPRPLPDKNGLRYVYQARVLVGQSALGQWWMTAPPPRSRLDPSDLFDSVVDHLLSPSIFVIFQGNQACPEYLITFE